MFRIDRRRFVCATRRRRSCDRLAPLEDGVDDGTRTHDDRDHNPGLYQLSYAHHGFGVLYLSLSFWRARQDSNLQHLA